MSTTTDPVCEMKVDSESRHSVDHAGKHYYFCSQQCVEKFQANPSDYIRPIMATITPTVQVSQATQAVGVYTCPMHPEVRQATERAVCQGSNWLISIVTLIILSFYFNISAKSSALRWV